MLEQAIAYYFNQPGSIVYSTRMCRCHKINAENIANGWIISLDKYSQSARQVAHTFVRLLHYSLSVAHGMLSVVQLILFSAHPTI